MGPSCTKENYTSQASPAVDSPAREKLSLNAMYTTDTKTCLLRDIHLRDPFVLPDADAGVYYLYGSTDSNIWSGPGTGFNAYRSSDLERWEGPFQVFSPEAEFWGKENFWAPEVHRAGGRFFMFATFRGSVGRGTAILAGESPLGPFHPHSDGPVTPAEWDALDGTLFLDADDRPWLVFCHEWLQCGDGKVCARRLSEDLRSGIGVSEVLFTASQAPWAVPTKSGGYVADGPFLYRPKNGSLLMLWSSFGAFGYAQGVAEAVSGDILGPWKHRDPPLWEADGGHGMLFRSTRGTLKLILHHPNQTPYERALAFDLSEPGDLRLKRRLAAPIEVARRFNRGGSRRRKLRFFLWFILRWFGIIR